MLCKTKAFSIFIFIVIVIITIFVLYFDAVYGCHKNLLLYRQKSNLRDSILLIGDLRSGKKDFLPKSHILVIVVNIIVILFGEILVIQIMAFAVEHLSMACPIGVVNYRVPCRAIGFEEQTSVPGGALPFSVVYVAPKLFYFDCENLILI